MTGSTRALFGVIAAAAAVTTPFVALAQDETVRTVEQYKCKDVMRESGSGRDTAIAFLHGYLLGKSGSTEFDLDQLADQTDDFIDYCLENPDDGAMDSMMKVKS